MDSVEAVLEKIYYDPENPSSFGSVQKLLREAKKQVRGISRRQVENWLSGQDTYTLHRSIKRKFQRIPSYADHVDSVWQLDTADVKHMKSTNDGIKFFLIIIDNDRVAFSFWLARRFIG